MERLAGCLPEGAGTGAARSVGGVRGVPDARSEVGEGAGQGRKPFCNTIKGRTLPVSTTNSIWGTGRSGSVRTRCCKRLRGLLDADNPPASGKMTVCGRENAAWRTEHRAPRRRFITSSIRSISVLGSSAPKDGVARYQYTAPVSKSRRALCAEMPPSTSISVDKPASSIGAPQLWRSYPVRRP